MCSEERAATLPGTVPRRRTDFARLKIVFVGTEGEDVGERVGVVKRRRFDGVKRDIVRLTDTGVNGRATISNPSRKDILHP